MIKPFCIKADKYGNCTEKKVRKLFWIFKRLCIDYFGINENCDFRVKPEKPKNPPPPFKVEGKLNEKDY